MYDICIYNFLNLLKKYEKMQLSLIAVNKMNVIQQIAYDIKKTIVYINIIICYVQEYSYHFKGFIITTSLPIYVVLLIIILLLLLLLLLLIMMMMITIFNNNYHDMMCS